MFLTNGIVVRETHQQSRAEDSAVNCSNRTHHGSETLGISPRHEPKKHRTLSSCDLACARTKQNLYIKNCRFSAPCCSQQSVQSQQRLSPFFSQGLKDKLPGSSHGRPLSSTKMHASTRPSTPQPITGGSVGMTAGSQPPQVRGHCSATELWWHLFFHFVVHFSCPSKQRPHVPQVTGHCHCLANVWHLSCHLGHLVCRSVHGAVVGLGASVVVASPVVGGSGAGVGSGSTGSGTGVGGDGGDVGQMEFSWSTSHSSKSSPSG